MTGKFGLVASGLLSTFVLTGCGDSGGASAQSGFLGSPESGNYASLRPGESRPVTVCENRQATISREHMLNTCIPRYQRFQSEVNSRRQRESGASGPTSRPDNRGTVIALALTDQSRPNGPGFEIKTGYDLFCLKLRQARVNFNHFERIDGDIVAALDLVDSDGKPLPPSERFERIGETQNCPMVIANLPIDASVQGSIESEGTRGEPQPGTSQPKSSSGREE